MGSLQYEGFWNERWDLLMNSQRLFQQCPIKKAGEYSNPQSSYRIFNVRVWIIRKEAAKWGEENVQCSSKVGHPLWSPVEQEIGWPSEMKPKDGITYGKEYSNVKMLDGICTVLVTSLQYTSCSNILKLTFYTFSIHCKSVILINGYRIWGRSW
jgi:hypothetical protein